MLNDSLTASKRARYCCHTALRDREEGINDTLPGYKRHLRRKFSLIWTAFSHRPLLHQSKLPLSCFRCYNCNHFFYCKFTCFDLFDRPFYSIRNHDLLLYHRRLLDRTDHISFFDFISDFNSRNKLPFQISFQRRNFHTPLQTVARDFHDIIQRSLDSIVNAGNQPRSEFYGHWHFHGFHRLSRSESGCLLIYLNRRLVSVHLYNFADQSLLTYTHDIKHIRIAHSRGNDQRSCYFFNYAFTHCRIYLPLFL